MITDEMLERAARDYPIGSVYDDVAGLYKNCIVRYVPSITGLGIEVGIGYVYWDGKWADGKHVSTHTTELEEARRIIYEED